jgi:hypothetical protein
VQAWRIGKQVRNLENDVGKFSKIYFTPSGQTISG